MELLKDTMPLTPSFIHLILNIQIFGKHLQFSNYLCPYLQGIIYVINLLHQEVNNIDNNVDM